MSASIQKSFAKYLGQLIMTSVFVFHEGMVNEEPPYDPHQYWKMRVVSMHKNLRTQEKWIVGAWFYTPSHLRDIEMKER